ncbi:hypothetical protein BCR42DRAFT_407047 [Absidia repens]|uniref:Uncharacterized protein n=1 Tax=Absidia repens TaxID=90262 RepID=A0A1X2IRM2_9FUNG|nr:hypothetical protein BCR42DRAFT_407047 [Absidia repens]
MDNLVSTDNESSTSYRNDTINTTALTDLPQSSQSSDGDNDTLTGANPGYAGTRNPLDGAGSESNVDDDLAMLDSDSDISTATRLEQDYNDNDNNIDSDLGQINNTYTPVSLNEETSKSNVENNSQKEDMHHDDDDYDQYQDNVDTNTTSQEETSNTTIEGTTHFDNNDTLREDGDGAVSGNTKQNYDTVDEDVQQQTWNDDDSNVSMEMDTQPDVVEQEEDGNINTTLGSTLDQALEGLMENGHQATTSESQLEDDSNIYGVPSSSYFGSANQSNTTSAATNTIGSENMDELVMVDFSCWLYGAIFVLICLRLPYVKVAYIHKGV